MDEHLNNQIHEQLSQFKETAAELKHTLTTHKGPVYCFQVCAVADLVRASDGFNQAFDQQLPGLVRHILQVEMATAINNLVYALLQIPLVDADKMPAADRAHGEEFGLWVRRLVEAERKLQGRITSMVRDSGSLGGDL